MRKLVFVFVFVILFNLFPLDSSAYSSFDPKWGDFNYTYLTSNTAIITRYVGNGGDVIIPSIINNQYIVDTIEGGAFKNCDKITSITIPDSVKTIGDYAFEGSTMLNKILIPTSVNYIGTYAFKNCISLKSIPIPTSITVIRDCTFLGCTGIESLETPSLITTIGLGAFSGCTGLKNISFPTSLSTIEQYAFQGCIGLASVSFPNSLNFISTNAFIECSNLISFNVDSNNLSFSSLDGVLFNSAQSYLVLYPLRKYGIYSVPNSVTSIGESAFENCINLSGIDFPEKLTSIGKSSFSNCSGLKNVLLPSSLTSIDNYAFASCKGLSSISIPDKTLSIGIGAFNYCQFLSSAYFYGNAPTMGTGVFDGSQIGFKVHYISGKTGFSDPWNGYHTSTFIPPKVPTDLKATSSSYNSITLTWNAVVGANGYTIYYSTSSDGTYAKLVSTTMTTFTNLALTTGTIYYYKVLAYKISGESKAESGFSSVVNAKPVLTIPTGLTAVSASYNSIKLTWKAVAGTTVYTVYRYNGSAYVAIKNLSATSFVDASLATGTKYIYKVSAYIVVGKSSVGSGLSGYVLAVPTLGSPSTFMAARYSASSIKLRFGAVAGASGYTIYRYNASSKTYVVLTTVTAASYINTGLAKNSTYYYKVAAYHLEGTKKVYGAVTVAKSAKTY